MGPASSEKRDHPTLHTRRGDAIPRRVHKPGWFDSSIRPRFKPDKTSGDVTSLPRRNLPTPSPRSRERPSEGVYKLGWFNSNIRLHDLSAGLEGWPSINPGTVTRRGDAALKRCLQEIPVRLRGPALHGQSTRVEYPRECRRRASRAGRAALVRWSSLEWTSACHAEDHGFKSRTGR